MQCAAVATHRSLRMAAPQSCWPRGDSSAATNGSWPQSAITPPTILPPGNGDNRLLFPHATPETVAGPIKIYFPFLKK